MSAKYAEAGNRGESVRSDCWVNLKLTDTGGIQLKLKSKVEVLYGDSIRQLINDMLRFFEITNVDIELEDAGAVPFVIMARLETAVRRLGVDKGKRYLPLWEYPVPASSRDRFRRSRLYLPGDQPKLFINAAIHKGDGLILDLEDSVAPPKKDAARILVRNALRAIDFKGAERMVRINQLPLGVEDLEEIIPQKPHLILIPKVETPDQVQQIDKKVDEILAKEKNVQEVFFMPILESGKGIINAYPIAVASKRNVALAIGLEDYTADIGTQRTNEGRESFFARSMLVNAARAAGIQAIDTVFSDVDDMEGLRESVREAKALGFDGKGCIHPRQIRVIHEAFAPGAKEIEKAKKIVLAFEEAERKGLGVVSLGSKMIDPPVVKRALRTIDMAVKDGIIPEGWRKENE
ncbi:MAG: HpcH/HpaI aldolase/citrate lyase family protein [Candidatus Aminicenantes bacterium]|nr:HpcH/HpaI aldolase/citrate lyase family protein [Candidatus Aminicenantes bacterium]NIM78785.1 HpcH/HpaI aldolase/citrate lyase family protein [Candidatus Aminicenantes bacterium]NIN18040.1 HpcH/HpaI aldolase/citrate lyase family protein [Candidatus Aminicenantes bacterium]NIN41940.1 HpcH/HpaI aldolase/citrate lyase family protein [Candidatus Aminicenantes bacterium]NIN84695.1 HpcH/HpaI aldolase/citrate lyase family protein [Candidatus Aminicenantes bacterium]